MDKKQELQDLHRIASKAVTEDVTVIIKHPDGFLFDADGEFVSVKALNDLLPVAIVEMTK